MRDEVADLDRAGIAVIQVDEPAFREGLPLRRADWEEYLVNAVAAFGLAAAVAGDGTAIHTHMCYSEFNDVMGAIAAMNADAISIETTRSRMEVLDAFATTKGDGLAYPAEIGPGVWVIHSPRVPTTGEMVELLELARLRLEDWQIWVNPDCGPKTRRCEEVRPALMNLVARQRYCASVAATRRSRMLAPSGGGLHATALATCPRPRRAARASFLRKTGFRPSFNVER